MSVRFLVRMATVADVSVVARHRVRMFADMGELPDLLHDEMRELSMEYLRRAIPAGEYVGWLASPDEDPARIVAGAGVQRRRTMPHPRGRGASCRVAFGDQAIVLNVFTEPEWRRRGLAALLMRHVMEWARSAAVDSLVLHASADGRALYERLGFVQTNEMRLGA